MKKKTRIKFPTKERLIEATKGAIRIGKNKENVGWMLLLGLSTYLVLTFIVVFTSMIVLFAYALNHIEDKMVVGAIAALFFMYASAWFGFKCFYLMELAIDEIMDKKKKKEKKK